MEPTAHHHLQRADIKSCDPQTRPLSAAGNDVQKVMNQTTRNGGSHVEYLLLDLRTEITKSSLDRLAGILGSIQYLVLFLMSWVRVVSSSTHTQGLFV